MQFIKGKIAIIENNGYVTTPNGDFLSLFIIITKIMNKKKRTIGFDCFGKVAEKILTFRLNDRVEVEYFMETKKYNNRWYTNIKAKSIEKVIIVPKTENPNQLNLNGYSSIEGEMINLLDSDKKNNNND